MTTVLDLDCRTVSTQFPFGAGWNCRDASRAPDARLAAEADQVQAGDTGSERACSASSHATSKHSASGSAALSHRSISAPVPRCRGRALR